MVPDEEESESELESESESELLESDEDEEESLDDDACFFFLFFPLSFLSLSAFFIPRSSSGTSSACISLGRERGFFSCVVREARAAYVGWHKAPNFCCRRRQKAQGLRRAS